MVALCLVAWVQAAAGQFKLSTPIESQVPIGNPQAVALGKVDQDSWLDAVVVGGDGEYSALAACYLGDGLGSFSLLFDSATLYLQPTDLVLGNFDGQAGLDLAAINNACG